MDRVSTTKSDICQCQSTSPCDSLQQSGLYSTTPQRASFCSNINQYTGRDPPSIEIDHFDASPFSESFSGMLGDDALGIVDSEERALANMVGADMSFNVERITDIQEIDPEWDDDEVDEIVFISPKMPSCLSTIMEDLQELDKDANSISSLSEFDIMAGNTTPGTFLIRKRDTRQAYTVKRFKATPSHTWPLELSILEMINDREAPFLPHIRWRLYEETSFSLIMDSYPGGTLLEYVQVNGPLPLPHSLRYASELVEGLSVIHAAGIQHRNITPSNLMIDAGGHIVLVGFEHACVDNDSERSQFSRFSASVSCAPNLQHEYRAPEVLLGWAHDYAVDCWGFGCILYYMFYGESPFLLDGAGVVESKERIVRGHAPQNGMKFQVSHTARDLMRSCMEPNPALRLNLSEIKGHAFFTCVNWSLVREKSIEAPYVPDPIPHKTTIVEHLGSKDMTIRHVTSSSSLIANPDPVSGWAIQTPAPPYTLTSPSIFSLKAREQVQEMLPSIFRIGNDGSRPSRSRTSTMQSACSSGVDNDFELDHTLPSPVPTYDSLRRRLDSFSLTPEERLARFWESLDQDVKIKPPGIGHHSTWEFPYLPRPLATKRKSPNKLHKTTSPSASRLSLANFAASTQRLSQFIKPAPTCISSAILRKHKSSPSLVTSSSLPKDGFPKGVEQIGNGIGFTYHPPTFPVPLPVSTPVNEMMARSKLKRQISGLKLGGSRVLQWGNALWTRKGDRLLYGDRTGAWNESEMPADVFIGRASSSTRAGEMGSIDEAQPMSSGDVFRNGMVPEVQAGIVSPVTDTNSTVNNSPYPESGSLKLPAVQMVQGSGTLRELLRDGGGRWTPTLRLVQ